MQKRSFGEFDKVWVVLELISLNVVYLFWIVMAKVASSSYFVCSSIVLVVWF